MTVSILIISHENIGAALIETATKTFEELPIPTTVVNVEAGNDPALLVDKLKKLIAKIDNNEGILILTDLFGSTPSNIATELQKAANVKMVCGLNLPMVMKVMNYPELSLEELADKAVSGGKDGVIEVEDSD